MLRIRPGTSLKTLWLIDLVEEGRHHIGFETHLAHPLGTARRHPGQLLHRPVPGQAFGQPGENVPQLPENPLVAV